MARITAAALVAAPLAIAAIGAAQAAPALGGALPGTPPLFPADNWWNTDVSGAPVDPGSAAFIAFINNGGQRFTPEVRKIFRAMQRYGLIVAENGSDTRLR